MSPPRKPEDFWDDKETSPEDIRRGAANRARVLAELIEHALTSDPLDAERVAQWHKGCLTGLSYVTGHESWLGTYRGSNHPDLKGMVVGVGGKKGTPPHRVKAEVEKFFSQLRGRMNALAAAIKPDEDKSPDQLRQIAEVAGWAHGEWVRIHPFANGSGRTARLIANWVLSRFRLLPVVGIRPRPEHPYGPAAAASMHGDHSAITKFILQLLEDPPSTG